MARESGLAGPANCTIVSSTVPPMWLTGMAGGDAKAKTPSIGLPQSDSPMLHTGTQPYKLIPIGAGPLLCGLAPPQSMDLQFLKEEFCEST